MRLNHTPEAIEVLSAQIVYWLFTNSLKSQLTGTTFHPLTTRSIGAPTQISTQEWLTRKSSRFVVSRWCLNFSGKTFSDGCRYGSPSSILGFENVVMRFLQVVFPNQHQGFGDHEPLLAVESPVSCLLNVLICQMDQPVCLVASSNSSVMTRVRVGIICLRLHELAQNLLYTVALTVLTHRNIRRAVFRPSTLAGDTYSFLVCHRVRVELTILGPC